MKIKTALNSGNLELHHRIVAIQASSSRPPRHADEMPAWAVAYCGGGGLVISEGFRVDGTERSEWLCRTASAAMVRGGGGHFVLQLTAPSQMGFTSKNGETLPKAFARAASDAAGCEDIEAVEIDASRSSALHGFIYGTSESQGEYKRDEETLNLLWEVVQGVMQFWEPERIMVCLTLDVAEDERKQAIAALVALAELEVGFVRLDCGGERITKELWDWMRQTRSKFPYHLILSRSREFDDAVSAVDQRLADAVAVVETCNDDLWRSSRFDGRS